jgi:aerobic carbon-monoxide dehydrogenase medium subunit
MKAPNFAYVKPPSLDQALVVLAERAGSAVPLAGGQSLMATLNMRLSAPEVLVDISELPELKGIRVQDGVVCIGAGSSHAEIAASPAVRRHLPLVSEAMRHVAHVAIRNRGTIGGSLAYADPAAELPACSVALDATFVIASRAGRRDIRAAEFYKALFETDLQPGELLVEVRLPSQRPEQQWGFSELARRHGDFALAGLAAIVEMAGNAISAARLVYIGCTDRAKLAGAVAQKLQGQRLPLASSDWLPETLAADLAPVDTPGLSAATKVQLAVTLTRRTLQALQTSAPG